MADGCDGVTLFGTTGEGAEFAVADRQMTLEQVTAGGLDPSRIIVSVGALSIPDIVALSTHALDQHVAGLLLMPPCVYRGGITEDGTFRFYATVIDRIARPDLRLYLYHFPDISGVPITPNVVRRLDERYPGQIAGVKDSSGDLDCTEALLRRFSHLTIYTGSEIHVPQVLASGGAGTICGLANVMPRLMRAMFAVTHHLRAAPLRAAYPGRRQYSVAPPIHPVSQRVSSPMPQAWIAGAACCRRWQKFPSLRKPA